MKTYLVNKHFIGRNSDGHDSGASAFEVAQRECVHRLRPNGASETSPGPANNVSAALGTLNVNTLCPERAREMWLRPRTPAKRHNTPVPLQGTIITLRQTQGGARSGSLALG